mmetsp:Transcript_28525/g.47903  ORF Transcript_28525/g.47903 Transcript_28525/m.47903 type:complete len:249 (-) Transcript_28525:288-1034(-)
MEDFLSCLCENKLYKSHYCEENIYKLAEKFCNSHDGYEGHAIFISSESKCTPIWQQKLSASSEEPVFWDYHVIFCISHASDTNNSQKSAERYIVDFDTKLGYPLHIREYLQKSFQPGISLNRPYRQLFRMVPAELFIAYFASDRSHMLKHGGGDTPFAVNINCEPSSSLVTAESVKVEYVEPVPGWPIIRGMSATSGMNLNDYVNMSAPLPSLLSPLAAHLGPVDGDDVSFSSLGIVVTLEQLLAWSS